MVEKESIRTCDCDIDYGIFDIYAWAFGCRCQYKENCNRFDFDYCGIDSELESGVACKFKLKFIYKGNKNVEALNIRTAEEIKVLKRNLESLKQDTSLEQAEKAAKMEKSRRILRICKRNAKSKRIYGSKSNRKMKSGQRHDWAGKIDRI